MKVYKLGYLFFLLISFSAICQNNVRIDQNLSGINDLQFNFKWSDVKFEKSSNGSLQIRGSAIINNGENDDAFKLIINKVGDRLMVSSEIVDEANLPQYVIVSRGSEKQTYRLKKGRKFNKGDYPDVDWSQIDNWQGPGVIKEISLIISLPDDPSITVKSKFGNIEIINCINNINIDNRHGDVLAYFKAIPKVCDLNSRHGFVDVSLPSSSSVDVDLHTRHGEIYTDLDIEVDDQKSSAGAFENKIVGVVNRGGNHIKLSTAHNNIYIRKL